ncbi:MAG: HDOD domain-containing protein [Ignavibacteriales bacterium]|nr:HDOD domain-containing protein [Ignavibacteriales bacterium]
MLDQELRIEKTKNILSKIYNLPALPFIIEEVNQIIENPKSSAAQLSQVISRDPGLSIKILSVANSPLYGFPRRVSTIDFAIIILGFNHIKNITIAFSIMDSFNNFKNLHFDQKRFWIHSLMTATAAKRLSQDLGYRYGGEAFTAGLLHDLGIPVICKYFGKDFIQIVELVDTTGLSYVEAEQQVLGATHREIGHYLIEKWNLPQTLADVILHHNNPSESEESPILTSLVHLADYMTNFLKYGEYDWDEGYVLDKSVIEILNLGNEQYLENFVLSYKELFQNQMDSLIF